MTGTKAKLVKTAVDDLTCKINGACMQVHNDLGPGHLEHVYHDALRARLIQLDVSFEDEPGLTVEDEDGNVLIIYRPDFRVEGKVWVELKAFSHLLTDDELAQVIDYLAADKLANVQVACEVAVLVNFGRPRLEFKRVLPPVKLDDHLRKRWGRGVRSQLLSADGKRLTRSLAQKPINRFPSVALMHVPIFVGDGKLNYEDRPTPHIQNDEDVLLAVEASGICGTDLNILSVPPAHKAKIGIVIGHEGVARVTHIGSKVGSLKAGDRVVIAPRLTCGNCAYCRRGLDNQCTNYQTIGTTLDGTFAPYAIAPERALYKVSDAVALDDAALFEPLSCVVGAFAKSPVKPGDTVCVIGAGPMGALFAMVARAHGAGKVLMTDVVPYRLEFAEEVLGATAINSKVHNPQDEVMVATGIGCDIVIDAVGNQLASAMNLARRGGTVILFGLRPNDIQQISQYHITRYDLNVIGAFVGLNPFVQTINLLESGLIKPRALITHRLPLAQLQHGVDIMRSGQGMKVLIEMVN
jgi:GxxExxY protein